MLMILNIAFGDDHGFSFSKDGVLIHNGAINKDWNQPQVKLFEYFTQLIMNSDASLYFQFDVDEFSHSEIYCEQINQATGEMTIKLTEFSISLDDQEGGATDGIVIPGTRYVYNSMGVVTQKEDKIVAASIVGKEVMKKGINVETEGGIQNQDFSVAGWHELGHLMMNVILYELNGNFKGEDFSKWTSQEQMDFAVSIENLFKNAMGSYDKQSTGTGQHNNYSNRAMPKVP